MTKKKRQIWVPGDLFLVHLKDGSKVVGQIVAQERDVLNSVTCAFFDWRSNSPSEIKACSVLPYEKVFSVIFVTRDLLDNGVWEIAGNHPVNLPKNLFPYEANRSTGFVGARVFGSGIVNKFLNAYYRLAPWDDWKKPNYLDGLLLSQDKKPSGLVYKAKKD
jgi:hypothetical protein